MTWKSFPRSGQVPVSGSPGTQAPPPAAPPCTWLPVSRPPHGSDGCQGPGRHASVQETKEMPRSRAFPRWLGHFVSLLTFFFPATVHVQYYSMSLRRAARRSDIYMIYGAPTSPAPTRHCTVTALQPACSLCRTLCWTLQLALEGAPESSASVPLARILSHGCTQLQGRSGVARHLAQPRPATGPGAWSGGLCGEVCATRRSVWAGARRGPGAPAQHTEPALCHTWAECSPWLAEACAAWRRRASSAGTRGCGLGVPVTVSRGDAQACGLVPWP